ncbi:HEPN domain-containing protein [Burkholderia glumae]|uniref:HEPN domain-containing protein n=1 Tax=Burkholderia glumae TaxID=337 RepID=UPI0020371BCA|nr:HEPN domain-containing protein [Burkholderia glumae]MCM2552616.1 HEPN domain-containing protein [Burkholderia glumae]
MTMLNAKAVFHKNIQQADELGALYDHLSNAVAIPAQFDDLLRSQVVNAVSAFDKLMHDLIRIGMVRIFESQRPATGKYLNEAVAIQHLPGLAAGAVPPPPVRFEEIVREKLSTLSFQDPKKIADGLSYIWDEDQKWQQIALGLGISDKVAKLKQRLIATRRNAIVHEADLDPVTNQKQAITRAEATDISTFLLALGNRICDLVV